MQTPKPLSNELAPHEALELDDNELDPDELDELEDPELDVVEEVVELDPVEADEVDEEDEEDELEVEVEELVDVDVDAVCCVEVATGVSLQGLLGKAIYEGMPEGIAGTWHFPLMKINPTSQTHSFPL